MVERLTSPNTKLCVVFAMLYVGCRGGETGVASVTVRDSAGVHIVENPGTNEVVEWRTSAQPSVDIGGVDRGEAYELFRVTAAVVLPNGSIAVANNGTNELRFFDSNGVFRFTAGRDGEGPGEFRSLVTMRWLDGAGLAVYDHELRRMSLFDSSGTFIRSIRLGTTEDVPWAQVLSIYDDGSWLAQGFANAGEALPEGLQRYEAPLYHFAADGTFSTDLGLFTGNETFFVPVGNRGFAVYEALFPRYTYRLAVGNRLYVAANDTYELRVYTPDGVLTDIIRRNTTPTTVEGADVRREREKRLALTSESQRTDTERALNDMPIPETFPAYRLVRSDDVHNVWVQDYPLPTDTVAMWTIFDTNGTIAGRASLPLGFDPRHIGNDFVLGTWKDDLDIEHVQRFSVTRSAS